MSKWILAAVAALLLAGFLYWQSNSVKSEYVNGLPQYNRLPDREYIFERDCYIFKFTDHDTEFPLVGVNLPGTAVRVPQLPAEVSPKYVGASLPGVRILDIAHTGDRFRIASVRRDTRHHHSTITFEILFVDEPAHRYPRLDAYWILDHTPEQHGAAPSILPDYAVPRAMK